ncbi:hypothetical protein LOK49_LG11G00261 [Camellia lanceoleosa]|uniref:Uncharacterized protein n=1 Tax=Camellia lanceoleosa TaxID=1840588 RepID=A0ACC0G5E2_9ERIC|nr:hypothetical protein LOK49_LG11G00261 [Camellia lanceoleosa]
MKPPNKNGGREGRELSSGVPQVGSEQSNDDAHTRERSVSPRHHRLVDRGSTHEDPTMEPDRSRAGHALCHSNLPTVDIHIPDLIVLLETKVEFSSMGIFFNEMGFTTSAHVDPIGRSGGISMIWNPSTVNVRVTEASSQLITTRISRQNYSDLVLSTVYASPNNSKRNELWQDLETLSQTMDEPWLLVGDFNDFVAQSEKRSLFGTQSQSQSQDQRRSRKFIDRMNSCNLMDLGCTGPRLT